MGFLLSNVFGLEKGARFFFYVHYIIQIHLSIFGMSNNHLGLVGHDVLFQPNRYNALDMKEFQVFRS